MSDDRFDLFSDDNSEDKNENEKENENDKDNSNENDHFDFITNNGDEENKNLEYDFDMFSNSHDPQKTENQMEQITSSTSKRGKKGKNEKPKKSAKKVWSIIGRVALSSFLIIVITGCLLVGAMVIYVFGFVNDDIGMDLDQLKLNFTTTVYVKDKATGEFQEYQRLHGGENRIWVGNDLITQNTKDAFVAIEDKRFMEHNGVDWKRTFSAFANMFIHVYSSNQGGSTITQQLVKNLTDDRDESPMRKIREIMRARKIEEQYYKDTILECYMNIVPLANGIVGVEVASNYYFGKSAADLTLVESAAIAAMTKEPELYRPDKKPEKNKERRNTVLKLMYEQEYITEEEYNEAKVAELTIIATKETIKEVEINSYFVDAMIDDVIEGLVEEYNYDKAHASKNFYNGGYKIYSTLDTDVQATMESAYKNMSFFSQSSKKDPAVKPESAMTIVDYEGHIVGIVGGKGEKTVNRGLNRAWSSPRQPGSTMKPIGAYAPALDYNMITYSSYVQDKPFNRDKDGKQWPQNWFHSYTGTVSIQKAIERSFNTIPVHLVSEMSFEKSYKFLSEKLGIKNLIGDAEHDLNASSLALGGCWKGITTTESAAAYATFGNLGKFYEPSTYYKVTDQYDNIILEQKPPITAMNEDTADVMNHLLQGVVYGSQGTGGGAASFSDMKAFAKTGTSSESNDLWFVGGSPYYVASCWYGFDMNEDIRNGGAALNVWKSVMTKLHKNLEYKEFPKSEFVIQKRFCSQTGAVAKSGCPIGGTGWYKKTYAPECTKHGGNSLGEIKPPSSKPSTGEPESPPPESEAAPPPSSQAPESSAETSAAPPPSSSSLPPASSSSKQSSTETPVPEE
ncbi:MAG: transglycosylase domain-containing protein [Oscillospiraceae bacterium]